MSALVCPAGAQQGTGISNVKLSRNAQLVQLSMDIFIAEEKAPRYSLVTYTPRLVGENDSTEFPIVAVYGRYAYYHDVREGRHSDAGTDTFQVRHYQGPRTVRYARTIDHQPWMENATLKMIRNEGGTTDSQLTDVTTPAAFTTPPPDTTYVVIKKEKDEELTGRVSGQAHITFRVNRTEILPTMFDNAKELKKIGDAISDVRANKDVRITRYTLKGYASPEGPYDNNVRLAKGRTESLRLYMAEEWGVPRDQITTDYEPEDWQGLRQYIENHRDDLLKPDALLAIIDQPMEPDAKLAFMARQHPRDYRLLLERCFPQLRRTDYTIEYEWQKTVRRDDGEDRQMVITRHQPQTGDILEDDLYRQFNPYQPWLALKTNMLFDALLTPNIEIEVPLGHNWSFMVEDWFPWLLHNKGGNLSLGRYIRPGHNMKSSAYELWTVGAEMRYWLSGAHPMTRPLLSGTFVGMYYANGKYDLEWDSKGDQGEFNSVGLTYGFSWPLARRLNLEASLSAGVLWGPRRHYHGELGDTHLIWEYTGHTTYVGPTKLKLSLAWILGPATNPKEKGGEP